MSLIRTLFDQIFPYQCPVCREIVSGDGLCSECWKQFLFIRDPLCSVCGEPFGCAIGEEELCDRCQKSPPFFDRHRSVFCYRELSKRLIFRLKHGGDQSVLPLLISLCIPVAMPLLRDISLILPVPLHNTRLARRGFNQASLVAVRLAHSFGLSCPRSLLIRRKNTDSQGAIPADQRWKNVWGAFDVRDPERIQGLRILLIDDVFTTGATLNACAYALKEAGALSVEALTLAKVSRIKE